MNNIVCNKENVNTSTTYLYFLRIFASVLVVLLHCITPIYNELRFFDTRAWWLCAPLNAISRTAVPSFFMMSGFLLLTNRETLDIKTFYKKRLFRLAVPLLVWNIIYFLYYNYSNLSFTEFFRQLVDMGTAYHLWFVYSMLGFYLIMPFLKRITDNCTHNQLWLLTVIFFFTSTIRPFINTVFHVYINLFDGAMINGYIPYLILGYLLGISSFGLKTRVTVYIGGIVGMLMNIFGNWYFSSHDELNLIFNEAYRINHVLSASAVFVLFKQIPWDRFKKLSRYAKKWSGYTFFIYFVHVLVLDICSRYISAGLTPSALIVCSFLITTLIGFAMAVVIDKVKFIKKFLM